MLFLSQEVSSAINDITEPTSASFTSATTSAPSASSNNVKEDEIDVFLSKQNGLIHRERDPQLWVQSLVCMVLDYNSAAPCTCLYCRSGGAHLGARLVRPGPPYLAKNIMPETENGTLSLTSFFTHSPPPHLRWTLYPSLQLSHLYIFQQGDSFQKRKCLRYCF